MPLVSVIVPNYNHAAYLCYRIDSILAQTFQDFELIILDDCSTDNSRDVLLEYENHPKVSHIIFNDRNGGSTFRQWNKGIELVKGKYIWIAESDDMAAPEFLETVVKEFEKRPAVGLIYTASKLIDENNVVTYEALYTDTCDNLVEYEGENFIRQKLSLNNSIWNASMMMFRKSVYPSPEKQKLFLNMHYCGDWFFYVLLSEQMDVLEIKKPLNFFRVHSRNVSSEAEKKGLTFIEGLEIYHYIQKKLNFVNRLNLAVVWAKKYNKYQRRFHYSRNTKKSIKNLLFSRYLGIYLINIPVSFYYSLKRKGRKDNAQSYDINAGV